MPDGRAASMGLLGHSTDSRVQDAIARGIKTVSAARKAAGVLSADQTIARKYLGLGAMFVAVGIDTTLLIRAAKELRAAFHDVAVAPQPSAPAGADVKTRAPRKETSLSDESE